MTPVPDRQSALRPLPRHDSGADRRNILFCIALFLIAVAATNPVLEMGVNDDWSYAHIAREFASRGHIAYNGWATPMMLPQIVWAGAFIKLFGFSFLAVRLSTVILGALLIPVLYYLGRESGLTPRFATFLTLLSALSPLVMPEAVSFMSDVPALFLFVLCFYGAVRSWKADSTKACLTWAGLVALAGVLSALNRQIYWVAPLLLLPLIAWIRRRQKGALTGLSVAWLSTVLAAACCAVWFRAKPYTLAEHPLDYWKHSGLRYLSVRMFDVTADLGITFGLVLLPVLVSYAAPGFKAASRKLTLLAVVLAVEYTVGIPRHHKMPSIGNILTEYGILRPGLVAIGPRPVILGPVIRDVLTMAVLLSCAGCGLALWKGRGNAYARLRNDPVAPALVLGAVFAAGYLSGVLFHSAHESAYDRYLIPLLPLAAIPLLRYYQLHIRPGVSGWSWALLTLFSLYGVATTHDALADARARLTAAQTLERAGIPRTGIMGGFEYDGWTQLDAGGYLNDGRIENPVGAYRALTCTEKKEVPGSQAVQVWYLRRMPAVHPRYFVLLSRLPELADGPVAPVGYTTWLPPARRQVFTQVLPGGGSVGCQ